MLEKCSLKNKSTSGVQNLANMMHMAAKFLRALPHAVMIVVRKRERHAT